MTAYETMIETWRIAQAEFVEGPVFSKIRDGKMGVEHYKALMRQIFHHARENPQIQALATAYFRGEKRQCVKQFLKHASQEIGHDYLALNDFIMCGGDASRVHYERPLPATTALVAYAYYQLQHRNPVGYLGYLFYLEYTPVQNGQTYMDLLTRSGVPKEAMTFIDEHAKVDVSHLQLMKQYVSKLISTEEDLQDVCYAIQTTAKLYARMVEEAFSQADHPKNLCIAYDELVPVRREPILANAV